VDLEVVQKEDQCAAACFEKGRSVAICMLAETDIEAICALRWTVGEHRDGGGIAPRVEILKVFCQQLLLRLPQESPEPRKDRRAVHLAVVAIIIFILPVPDKSEHLQAMCLRLDGYQGKESHL
jgi:hypothetical protein